MDTLPLTDEYFLLAHHGYTGRPHINLDVLAAGLVAALVFELLIDARIQLVDGRIVQPGGNDHCGRVADPMAERVLDQIAVQTVGHPVRAWIEYVRDTMSPYEEVRDRLVRTRLIRPVISGLIRKSTGYVATDPLVGAEPRVRLRHAADHPDRRIGVRTAALASLAWESGLADVIADGANRSIKENLLELALDLPVELRPVAVAFNTAVTMIALSVRGR